MKCSLLTLSTFLDDEVDARKRGEVEAHLVACDRCSRGLTHLREESDRVSLLAQVHVADHSAHALMEQVGILNPGTQLPMRTNASVTVIPEDTPPWLTAGTGKAALPWRPQRAVPPTMPAPATPSEFRSAPARQDEGESSDGSSPPIWNDTSDQYVVDETTEPIDTESEEQPAKPVQQPWFPPGTTAKSLTADPRLPLVTSPPRAVPPRPQPPVPPAPPTPAVEFVPHPPAETPPAIPGHVPEVPVAATPAPETQSTPVVEQPALSFRPEPASAAPPQTSIYDEPVDDPDAHDEIPVVQDEIPVPRTPEPIFTPAASPALPPVRAARPSGFMARVRDALAVRRAVRSLPDDDSVDMFNQEITPSINHPRRAVSPPRDEAAQERRLQAAAAAAAPENTESVRDELEIKPEIVSEPEPVPEPEPLYAREPVAPPEPIRAPEPEPLYAREPVAPPEPIRVPEPTHPLDPAPVWEPIPEVPVAAIEDETSLHDLREQALKPPRSSFGASRKPPGLRARSLQTRIPSFDKRLLLVGAVALLVLVIGLATGKSSKVASPASASRSTPATSVSTHTSTTSASASATPQATPTGTSVALTNTHTLGNGGTGYAVDDLRYGQHTGFFRIVFDLSGGKGLPTVVVGFKNPTTMDVVFTGATPSSATGLLPNTKTVTKVTILPRTTSGQTVYEFTLAHAVTVKPVYYVGPPVHLILDLS